MAKKFKFRLEKVLELREEERENRKKELMLKNRAVNEVTEKLDALRSKYSNSIRKTGEIKAQELQLVAQYEARLKQEIESTAEALELLVIEAEKAKEQYLEAVKDHEALKVLKTRRQAEYQLLIDRAEAKELDELAVQRFERNNLD
jgi:flagellar FliJ protein